MKRFTLSLGLGLFFLFAVNAFAAVPQLINFQGVLRDSGGNPVADGSYSVTFKIYDAPSGGTVLWTETQSATTSGGSFNVLLGATNAVPDSAFSGANRYLGIAVASDPEMSPRFQLVSVGYAYRVNSVDGAFGGNIGGDVNIFGRATIGANTNAGAFAFVAGTGNTVSGVYSSISGGDSNIASGQWATIGGGEYNVANAFRATVGGGGFNTAGDAGTVGGGYSNAASNSFSTVGGGSGNNATSIASTVGGGDGNTASGLYSTVGGGNANTASNEHTTISGGAGNRSSAYGAAVGGGFLNRALGDRSTVSGGSGNVASGYSAAVGGGQYNFARGQFSTVSGGGGLNYPDSNLALGGYSAIGGGSRNKTVSYATISGGWGNYADSFSTIGGGAGNTAIGPFASVIGGGANTASGYMSTVAGGDRDTASGNWATVPGGQFNKAAGSFSFAAGRLAKALHGGTFVWADTTAADFASTGINQFLIRAGGGVGIGTNSPEVALQVDQDAEVAFFTGDNNQGLRISGTNTNDRWVLLGFDGGQGKNISQIGSRQTGSGSFLSFGTSSTFGIGITNEAVTIDPSGKVGIGLPAPAHPLHMASGAHVTAGGTWTNASSRSYKTDIQPLKDKEYADILEQLENLDVVRFRYKADPNREHIGLIAEDVPDEMASLDRKGIPTADAIAFLTAALKAQQAQIENLKKTIRQLQENR
ncbi:MAG: tail fiber domain-containing protein [candidate division Zixibacteria bacterium]|nr:tail fiber domain-containing protein [candidate division Zixibacteria bacterium]